MRKAGRHHKHHSLDEALLAAKRGKAVPHEFVLEEIASLSPVTRPMFGCVAVYVEDKIVLVLRDKPNSPADNGIWLATTAEHHESLRREFPRMRSIRLLGKEPTGWQVLAADDPDFEGTAMRACKLILARDSRIGKEPNSSSRRSSRPPGRARPAPARHRARDNSERSRYELELRGGLAFIDYRRDGRIVTMTHAEVPPALRGGGAGSTLVKGALALVRERGEKVIPLCSFVAHYMQRHAEVHDLLAVPSGP